MMSFTDMRAILHAPSAQRARDVKRKILWTFQTGVPALAEQDRLAA